MRSLALADAAGAGMAEEQDAGSEGFTNRVALTIAVVATFLALSTISSGNVAQSLEQAQAERNNSWAWYQAVRVREDMGTYELAHLQRLAREAGAPATLPVAQVGGVSTATPTVAHAAPSIAEEITAQETEVAHIRARKDEVEARARAAEADVAALSRLDDQYDLSDALIAIATALLAICALAKTRWLYWFSLAPALSGMALGGAAMANVVLVDMLVAAIRSATGA